uniref:Uncharacterized protein n=1 Tax=Chromera velia CCMP2878 TaxID=1169474 RepID=A0A0G4IBL2_9ALVE|eukprot:Cvel_12777.t1-p1 / transcript=Cvel_12777.t1 / gene=Cvel_12777 / organism=Chromera_velia_CCMP2878 / gene_product=hypothetical protein / transcript_product=hypothetical protein / location=Cvel_scaffold850:31766-32035(+) / protein_length=90 / sequence_SO=supercontig / SO=protein_coding / is_pseudo=false
MGEGVITVECVGAARSALMVGCVLIAKSVGGAPFMHTGASSMPALAVVAVRFVHTVVLAVYVESAGVAASVSMGAREAPVQNARKITPLS